jgi:hypothetical protein
MLNSMLKIFVGPAMGGGGLNPHQPPREYDTAFGVDGQQTTNAEEKY